MPTFSPRLLSESVDGLPIVVAATTAPGTLLHTALAGMTGFDEVRLFASNVTAADAVLTVLWGGATVPGHCLIKDYTIPANSPAVRISAGQPLNNEATVTAYSGTASAINITGGVTRIE